MKKYISLFFIILINSESLFSQIWNDYATVISENGINIRNTKGLNAKVLVRAPQFSKLKIIEHTNIFGDYSVIDSLKGQWIKVKFN